MSKKLTRCYVCLLVKTLGKMKALWLALKTAGKSLTDFESREEMLEEAIKLQNEQIDQALRESGWDVDVDENGPFIVMTKETPNA